MQPHNGTKSSAALAPASISGEGTARARAQGTRRTLLLVAGSAALVVAFIGAILPVMPTTPFLLLSAYCFARSSERCYTWLTTNRIFGKYVTQVRQGRGLSARMKTVLIASSWATASVSAFWLAPNLTVRIASLCIAAGMSGYIVLQGRRKVRPQAARSRSGPSWDSRPPTST